MVWKRVPCGQIFGKALERLHSSSCVWRCFKSRNIASRYETFPAKSKMFWFCRSGEYFKYSLILGHHPPWPISITDWLLFQIKLKEQLAKLIQKEAKAGTQHKTVSHMTNLDMKMQEEPFSEQLQQLAKYIPHSKTKREQYPARTLIHNKYNKKHMKYDAFVCAR